MANNIYVIDVLATGTPTITISDDGTGLDWLDFNGIYTAPTSIRLAWTTLTTADSPATSASGFYFSTGNTGHRLVVNGLIENARGSNGNDDISGNSADNLLFGDQLATGPGRADTLFGANGDDTIYGGAGDDNISGAGDDDRLIGGTGADTINGGGGLDTIAGGAGADNLSGGSNIGDTLNYGASTAAVRVQFTFGTTTVGLGGDAAGDRIFGFTDVIGSAFADVLIDTVSGTVAFGGNDNVFNGGDGADSLQLNGGNDTAFGGNGNDRIYGGGGNDALAGGAGNDLLVGGLGKDTLTGNSGADMFTFTAPEQSTFQTGFRDTIRDYTRSEGDRINLQAIDAIPGGANDAFRFVGSAAFSGAAGELRIQDTGDDILVMADLNGDGRPEFAVLVLDEAILVRGDFIL